MLDGPVSGHESIQQCVNIYWSQYVKYSQLCLSRIIAHVERLYNIQFLFFFFFFFFFFTPYVKFCLIRSYFIIPNEFNLDKVDCIYIFRDSNSPALGGRFPALRQIFQNLPLEFDFLSLKLCWVKNK